MGGRVLPITVEHRERLVRRLQQRVGPYWAEDLAQETLAAAWANPNTPDREPDLTRWLYAIARNLAASRLRVEMPVAPLDADTLPAAIEAWDGDQWAAALDAGMSAVPESTRQAITLRYLDGYSQAETAQRLGIAEGALEGRLHRGKRAIHRELIAGDAALAVDLGLVAPVGRWLSTGIWCDACGRQRLEGMWREDGGFRLDCPSCQVLDGRRSHMISTSAPVATSVAGFRAASGTLAAQTRLWANNGLLPQSCPYCRAPAAVDVETFPGEAIWQVAVRCSACPHRFWALPHGLAGATEAFATWRKDQHRIAWMEWPIPIRRPGETRILTRWRSLSGTSTFEALVDPTFRQPIETVVDHGHARHLR